MNRYYEDDYRDSQEARERDLKIIWKCPNGHYEYEDYPCTNEALSCPTCGERCRESGESYLGRP